jgi:alpha-beta hydrolase superfamily lysophospholipase
VRYSEGSFRGAGGLELHYRRWLPDADPRAAVVLVHGVCEHGGRYTNVVDRLAGGGYAVYAYDQRGHGASPGRRVHVDRWAEYREDLDNCLAMAAEQVPERPIVVYGHSMGSLVVLDYLLHDPRALAGAIISGAALEPAGVGTPYLVAVARILSGITPRFSVSLGLDVDALSRDPEVLEPTAPIRSSHHARPCAGVPRASTRSSASRRACGRIDVPLLVLHGEDDRLNLAEGARTLFEAVSHPSKRMHIYPGVRHEPHNDFGHEQVVTDVEAWLASLVSGQACP